ncbi:hypothetical protein KDL44_12865 [bacterium]|nr:hypothetical protein [bacterium]
MRFILTLFILLIVGLAGCGGLRTDGIPVEVPDHLPGQEFSTELPAMDSLRSASQEFTLQQNGSMAALSTATAIIDGNDLLLPSGANYSSWGIWTFACGYDYPTTLSTVVEVSPGSEYWLAISDYGSGRWNISGPHHSGISVDLNSGNLSTLNNMHLAILTSQGHSVRVQKLVLNTDNGWTVVNLGYKVKINTTQVIDAAIIAGNPAVCYVSAEGVVSYARATVPLADLRADWPEEASGIIGPVDNYSDIGLSSINELPALAFINGLNNWGLYYGASSTPEGGPADWTLNPDIISSGSNYGPTLSLTPVADHPAIAFVDSGENLVYRRSSSTDGLTSGDWDNSILIEEADQVNEHPQKPLLFIDRGKPSISYVGASGQPYLRSSDSSTGGKPSNWSKRETLSIWQDGSWAAHDVLSVNGKPGFFHYDSPTLGMENDSLFLVLNDTVPEQEGWEGRISVRDFDYHIPVPTMSGANIDGKPAVCYRAGTDTELWYSFADPEAEFGLQEWQHQLVNAGESHGGALDVELLENAAGQPCLFYAAFDQNLNAHVLYYAVRREP